MARIFLDTAPIIYLVEGVEPFLSVLLRRLSAGEVLQVTGELSRLEARVRPIKLDQSVLLAAFDSYFSEVAAEIIPITRPIIDVATQLRAEYGYRIPDAIQLASAIVSGCDSFVTNDVRLQRCEAIPVELLSDQIP